MLGKSYPKRKFSLKKPSFFRGELLVGTGVVVSHHISKWFDCVLSMSEHCAIDWLIDWLLDVLLDFTH